LLIVSSLKNQSENEESDDSSENMNTHGPSPTEAFASFETGLEWLEIYDTFCPAQLLLLKRLRNLVAQKHVTAIRLTKNNQFVKK
jgi:hypothetical protein